MTSKEKALKQVLNGLSMLYIHLSTKPKDEFYVDILLSFNKALLQMEEIDTHTVEFLDTAIKSISDYYYAPYKSWLSRYCQDLKEYDYENCFTHLDALITVNRKIIDKLEKNEYKEAKVMANSVLNYPDYILGRIEVNPIEFFNKELCYYKKKFDGIFLDGFAPLFA